MGRALVLGGGGITGIAWELGMLAGLQESGTDLTGADTVVGTSAGSIVGAQLTSGTPLEELYTRQLRPPEDESAARLRPGVLARWAWAVMRERDPDRARARVGRMAHANARSSLVERRRVIASRLTSTEWPDADLRVTAVDARTGRRTVFRSGGAAGLLDAVTASCAVPGVWPPAIIGERPYVDGGVHSPSNIDLAEGFERVVVLAPVARTGGMFTDPRTELAALPDATATALVTPDPGALAAMGSNNLDPAHRPAAARAGRTQAAAEAARIAEVWGGD
ncbi:patatin-like phospholipase family protein [Streptomonospora litoralis]|uniref:PNPLA domain-containing protein n=1 Tax=Streptomonospora litoralis TaxID=2498135 RepID=A0A4P6Q1P7_9ACTN|nr:patatin-like phospholipase family protein [Streptomonospora litoralis]QBI52517.1 hypothetical protein EKD16_03530 [Streptomonospora litoralis]